MFDYLLFRLYGPMAAWGDTAVGEFRPSQAHPSRTAVLGLLAAALGIRRDEEAALLALDYSVRVGVRLDLPGDLLRDYHTSQVPPENRKRHYYTRADEMGAEALHTILSQRDYRTDSGASIALRHDSDDNATLARWQNALRNPVFPPYLGRKACPLALPMDPVIMHADSLKTAFAAYPDCATRLHELSGLAPPQPEHTRYFWEGEDFVLQPELSYPRRDRLLSRRRWQFAERTEHQAAHPRTPDTPPDKGH